MEITSGKLASDVVRRNWRDVLDYVEKGGNHVVVSRSAKPIVAIIPFEDFRALVEELEDLSDGRAAMRNIAADLAAGDPVALQAQVYRDEETA